MHWSDNYNYRHALFEMTLESSCILAVLCISPRARIYVLK